MGLFKILRGDSSRISTSTTPFHDGYAYFTPDDGGFYIDATSGNSNKRIRINTPVNDQTPTYTKATVNAELVSGEKLSVAFGKIAKAISSLISHLANKSNPHGVTAAQVGALASNGNAVSATKAAQDSAGQQINSTYIKNLSISGKVITYTKGDGSTGTITTQDTNTTYSSLKNPYALTVQLNGTSQGAYDGSSSKTINITPAGIGATTVKVSSSQPTNQATNDIWYKTL